MDFVQKVFLCFTLACCVISCAPKNRVTRSYVSDELKKRSGFDITKAKQPGQLELPPNILISDGITEDEAIGIALWNNGQFQADLASISILHADVIDAGIVLNPLLRYLSPNAGIMASGYINFAFDFLWLRPRRIAAATIEAERNAGVMIQRGFALIRDVQLTYADLQLALDKAAILAENARIRGEMSRLSNIRLRYGEISELEALTFRADSAAAVDQLVKANLDTIFQRNRLYTLLGFAPDTTLSFQSIKDTLLSQKVSRSDYLELAGTYQPELQAARLAIESAGKRLGWERARILAFTAVLNYERLDGAGNNKWLPDAFNPGFQIEIPILNRNQGKIARARAEMEQASFQYVALRQRIALDVSDAYNRYEQTYKSYEAWSTGVIPSLEEAVRLVQLSYERGDISYLPVLEALRQLVNGKLRKAEIEAELRRSVSQLNYGIGNNSELK
ncbi:MAG: TolC family protein [Chitinophagaceae bacterium]|nr:TolC family protein [Chitinophagaceae bacterium]